MEEYNFVIEHRPGARHGNADALSRRPCTKKDSLCQQPASPLFSGSADQPVSSSASECDDVTPRNLQQSRSTEVVIRPEHSRKSKSHTKRSAPLSGPADSGRPSVQHRFRLWWPAMLPNLETIDEESDVEGEYLETDLNPEAEPFVPSREATAAAVQVEPDTSVDPVVSTSDESSTEQESVVLPWSIEGLIAAQKADPDVGLIYQLVQSGIEKPTWNDMVQYSKEAKTLWSFWPRLQVRNGLLQRKFTNIEQHTEIWQTVLPKSHRSEFIDLIHAGSTGGHFGLQKTSAAVQNRAYWPSWSSDIESYIRRCAACAQYHRGAIPKQATLQTPVVGEPWERVSIDITGPHPRSSRQNVYILTLVDHFFANGQKPFRSQTTPLQL